MAHIWLQNANHEWTAIPLSDDECRLESLFNETIEKVSASDGAPPDVRFLRTEIDNQENWAVVTGYESGVTINGIPLSLGIRVFRDRDEIRWSREGIGFFSSEEPASVVDFPQGDRKVFCPRCKQRLCRQRPPCDARTVKSGTTSPKSCPATPMPKTVQPAREQQVSTAGMNGCRRTCENGHTRWSRRQYRFAPCAAPRPHARRQPGNAGRS